jgi:sugar-specific transcriptional regulator TrmB
MRIAESTIRRIIREEARRALREGANDSDVIMFLRKKIPSLQDEKLKALEELVEDFLYSYGKSKEYGNEDHEWHAIDADNAAGEIYGFAKDNGTEIGDTFFDDLKTEFVEDY